MEKSIYETFKIEKDYSEVLQHCIERTVNQLLHHNTNVGRPGMLLGNIQSGKTKAFIGIIAKAFDDGYDIAVILTKGTKALAKQTVQRLENEFDEFVDLDKIKIYDIMTVPSDLNEYVLGQKLIFVVKKEDDNLKKLDNIFHELYPGLGGRQTLIIDDEADFASVGFRKKKNEEGEYEMNYNVLAKQISQFRSSLNKESDFLQVTATPYSLYLQPDEIVIDDEVFEPVKPAFTELVPIHERYVGAKYYFENSLDKDSPAHFLHFEIPEDELQYLANTHGSIKNNLIDTKKVENFRFAIITYLLAGAIRQIQCRLNGDSKIYKSSFIIHTEVNKQKHENQYELCLLLINKLKELNASQHEKFITLMKHSYDEIMLSLSKTDFYKPSFDEVLPLCIQSLNQVLVRKINSDNDVMALLNAKTGELKLDSVYNIFIGGQILDRGITIQNLIGFFYGRNPQKMQQDTVMQHSRMYGARSLEDMAVTRLYTTSRIHANMRSMYDFDSSLRAFFENDENDKSVIFIQKDKKGQIIPCSPNKILLSNTITISKHKRLLPIGFQTKAYTHIHKSVSQIDTILSNVSGYSTKEPFFIDMNTAEKILQIIDTTYVSEKEEDVVTWSINDYLASLRYMMEYCTSVEHPDKLWCIVRTNRDMARKKENNRAFSDAPDDGKNEGRIAKQIAVDNPCLVLLKQIGRGVNGWKDAEFWWPVLFAHNNIKTCIFATELVDN